MRALIDSGSASSIVSLDFARRCKLPLVSLSSLNYGNVELAGVGGGVMLVTHCVQGMLSVMLPGVGVLHIGHETLLVGSSLIGKDMILGAPWLIKRSPRINWATGQVAFRARPVGRKVRFEEPKSVEAGSSTNLKRQRSMPELASQKVRITTRSRATTVLSPRQAPAVDSAAQREQLSAVLAACQEVTDSLKRLHAEI